MCGLCSENEEERCEAQKHELLVADALDRLAGDLRNLARGVRKPHDHNSKNIARNARFVVRELVADWV